MSTKLLTNLLFEPKGVHDPALTYSIKDTVMSADGSRVYFALQDVPAGIALSDEEYWKLQIDLSASKTSMDNAIADFANYAKIVGTKVRGETANATGNPVTFLPDAGSLLQPVTVLEPQQHGSGEPYPAGGGKNLINLAFSASELVIVQNADGTITATNNTGGDISGPKCELTGVLPAGTYTISRHDTPNDVYLQTSSSDYSNNITTYTFNYDGVSYLRILCSNIKSGESITYKIQLELGSTATEYAPPSNIRPFIGYDKLGLNVTGKNLLPKASAGTKTTNGITFTVDADGSVTANGTATSISDLFIVSMSNMLLLPAGTYILSGCPAGGAENKYAIIIGTIVNGGGTRICIDIGNNGCTFTLDSDTSVYILIRIHPGVATSGIIFRPMIRLASDLDSTYAPPYQSTLHTVQIGQTVYGFRYEWLTGKGVIEWAGHVFDGTEDIGAQDDYGSFYTPKEPLGAGNSLCSHAWARGNEWFLDGGIAFITEINRVIFYNALFGARNRDEFVACLAAQKAAGTPVQVCWKLAQPIEIQLTPHIISAVEPEQNNTLYGDGSIEVEFVKPLHVSIEEHVAAALAAAAE